MSSTRGTSGAAGGRGAPEARGVPETPGAPGAWAAHGASDAGGAPEAGGPHGSGGEYGKRGIGHLVCGRRAKWLVLALWLVVLFLAAPLAQKLTDAQDNDAASWLPGSAESTQVLEISEDFRPEQIPAIVVYARESGLTAADRERIAEDADARVGGGTAALLDMDRATTHDNLVIIPLVLLVVLLTLCAPLRALIAPLLLIGTVILSFAAALGLSALAFRYVFDYAGESTDFPLFAFVFLVALGIDYNIFLTTRIREEAGLRGTRRGVVTGLATTGTVITSAGLVLAGTFAALGTLPMVAFAEIGFAVALGVLLDTFIVRSALVTSLFLDVGPRVWWPHRLAREDGAGAVREAEVQVPPSCGPPRSPEPGGYARLNCRPTRPVSRSWLIPWRHIEWCCWGMERGKPAASSLGIPSAGAAPLHLPSLLARFSPRPIRS